MESANLHHQHQQDLQQAVLETSSLSSPSCYGVGSSHSWPPNITLNNAGNFCQNLEEAFSRSRTSTGKHDIRVPPLNGSMIQDLGYNWASDPESSITSIKEENISDHTFPKFTDLLNSPSSMENYRLPPHTTDLKNEQHKDHLNVLSEKLLLKTLSSGEFYSSTVQSYPNFGSTGVLSRGNFSQIYPSINISSLNQSSSAISSSLDMNMQCMDLSTSARINNGGLSQRLQDCVGGFAESLSFRLDNMQNPTDRSPSNSSNPSHFGNGMAETKRPSALMMEPKSSQPLTASSKKSRSESRTSCPPFKVRKEKLGDRIAALQQLVAPFGKTDTASVLMEAIGYIKFLQSQVETLSVPYMKSSRNQTNRSVMHHGSSAGAEEGKGEARQDLRSRGLCLVPLSCMSYLTGDGGGGVWQQPNFGGAT